MEPKEQKRTNKVETDSMAPAAGGRLPEGRVKGLRSSDWHLGSSRGGGKCGVGDTVGDTVITTCGARRALEINIRGNTL